MTILDYAASGNTTVNGISIATGMSPGNVDNAMRAIVDDTGNALRNGYFATALSSTKTTNYTVLTTDRGKILSCTAAITITLPAAATAAAGFLFYVKAMGGSVILDPNGAELIDGAATVTLASGSSAFVSCTGSAWVTAFVTSDLAANTGKALKYIYLTSDTWTKPAEVNFLYAVVTVVAGGGGSGAIGTTIGAATGGSGGGGGAAILKILAASLAATETVTVGAGGTAGTAGGAGGTGGTSSFGAHVSATGGVGGLGTAGGTYANSSAGGVGSSGNVNFRGGGGVSSLTASSVNDTIQGGASGLGYPGASAIGAGSGSVSSVAGGANSGGGASGPFRVSGTSSFSGLAGGSGLVIVEEFYGS